MDRENNSEVYSKVVRAGKRTYFFDVKATKGNDLYLVLTESKKAFLRVEITSRNINYFFTKKILINSKKV